MLFMSKHSSDPSSDFLSAALIRFRRSWRSRSRLTRSSQSTAIRPKVLRPMAYLLVPRFQVFQTSGNSLETIGTTETFGTVFVYFLLHNRRAISATLSGVGTV